MKPGSTAATCSGVRPSRPSISRASSPLVIWASESPASGACRPPADPPRTPARRHPFTRKASWRYRRAGGKLAGEPEDVFVAALRLGGVARAAPRSDRGWHCRWPWLRPRVALAAAGAAPAGHQPPMDTSPPSESSPRLTRGRADSRSSFRSPACSSRAGAAGRPCTGPPPRAPRSRGGPDRHPPAPPRTRRGDDAWRQLEAQLALQIGAAQESVLRRSAGSGVPGLPGRVRRWRSGSPASGCR